MCSHHVCVISTRCIDTKIDLLVKAMISIHLRYKKFGFWDLTHCRLVTSYTTGTLVNLGSDNGLSPIKHQAIN